MCEQVRCHRRHAFIFAKQIRHGGKDERALADFVDGDQWVAAYGRHQRDRALQFQPLIAKYLAAQILRRFAGRKAARVVRFASQAG